MSLYKDAEKAANNGDLQTAFRLLTLALERGCGKAAYALGVLHMNGQGIEKDQRTAAQYYRIACEQDIADACYAYGLCLENGYTGILTSIRRIEKARLCRSS